MSLISQNVTLPGGRSLDAIVDETAGGPALVLHHGTPSDATLWLDWASVAREHGFRLVAMSRPGYATSSRMQGRSVASAADDIAFLLDTFDIPWFVTAGWSGGGPHALACAARLGDRCRSAATLAGVAPYGEPDLAFLDGMGPENHAEFGAACAGESAVRTWLDDNAAALRTVTAESLADTFGGLVPQVDRDALYGGFAERMAATFRRALESCFDGWIDDDLAFTKPWEIDVRAISVPVTVWQGDLDLMVPASHGAWLAAQIPNAVARQAPGHGHISLVTTYRDEIVRDLLERAAER